MIIRAESCALVCTARSNFDSDIWESLCAQVRAYSYSIDFAGARNLDVVALS